MSENLFKTLGQSPRVTIVMAVCKPREDWFAEQLLSLNAQSYENLDLIICDDSPDSPVRKEFIEKFITRLPFRLIFNEKNVGSNKTFERLTLEAEGDYIAYCDQDDIWEDNKLAILVKRIIETNAILCYSDLSIIDENDHEIAGSITKIRKRHVFREGEHLSPALISRNFVTGCAMIINTDTAKAAVPFEEYMVHDHWLTLYSAISGKLAFEPTTTVKYRQHRNNQTGVLIGVNTKEDYFKLRIELLISRICWLKSRMKDNNVFLESLENIQLWTLSRKCYYENPSIYNLKKMWMNKRYGMYETAFEAVMPLIPNVMFKKIVKMLK